MRRGGLLVFSSAWREKGMMRKLCKKALRVFREFKERTCVHCFWLAKPLGIQYTVLLMVIALLYPITEYQTS